MFERVGLKANEKKTKFMIVRGAKAPKALSSAAHENVSNGKRKKVVGETCEKRRKTDVTCDICGKQMRKVSLQRHLLSQHGTKSVTYESRDLTCPLANGTHTLWNFTKGRFNKCPFPNCVGGGKDTFGIYRHFCNRHPNADIIIRGDKNVVKCNLCGMKCYDLEKHQNTKTCKINSNRRRNERQQDLQAKANNVKFYVNGKEIQRVTKFLCLGRWFAENDDDTFNITENIKRARSRWNSLVNILKREGADAKCMGRFYLVIVQAVLLYGADSWSISSRNMGKLRSFHNRTVRCITGDHIVKNGDTWTYPNHNKLLKKAKLLPISTYIDRRRGTLRKYLELNRNDLLATAMRTKPHCYDANKILWWKQQWIEKGEMNQISNDWFAD